MGCGKSKHDVVTGNTTKIRKPSEVESVKGKESETIKRQESCRCRKQNDISAVVSSDQPETTVENNTKKPEVKEDVGDCGEKTAVEMRNGDKKPEDKKTTTSSSPVKAMIVPENIVTEGIVNDVNESVSFSPVVDEQKEKNDIETVVEEEKSVEDNIDGNVDTEITSTEVEEPKPDVQTPVTTELEVQEILTTENEEIAAAENDETVETKIVETPVLKDEDKVDVVEENPADITKEVDSV